jgi:hypothetical protein
VPLPRDEQTPGSQLALFNTWDYHAFVTDRTLPLPEVEADLTDSSGRVAVSYDHDAFGELCGPPAR